MSCLIPRSFQKDPWKKLDQTETSDSMSTKSLLDDKSHRESDTHKTFKRKNLATAFRSQLHFTVLGRLILNRKYEVALRRLKKTPREASIWVLPIHIACSALSTCLDNEDDENDPTRAQLELLVRRLALTFPGGCAQRDHAQRLPLHEALRYNASSETISLLLMASPETVDETDKYGRLPYEIKCGGMGDHKDVIAQFLKKDQHYWTAKREEFYSQPQHGNETYFMRNLLRLQCVLGGRLMGKETETIRSQESELQTQSPLDDKAPLFTEHSKTKISPKSLSESRLRSERSSNDILKVKQDIIRLQALKAQYTLALTNENLAKRVVKLEKEKSEMRLRIEQMIKLVKVHGLASCGVRDVRSPLKSGLQAMIADSEENSRSTCYSDHFKKSVLASKIFATDKKKRRSSQRNVQVFHAVKEEAKRDIVFVPDHYINANQGGPPGTAFERGQFAKDFWPDDCRALGSYDYMDAEAGSNLENLLDMAEHRFGHTFSPGTLQAWRQISLPDPVE